MSDEVMMEVSVLCVCVVCVMATSSNTLDCMMLKYGKENTERYRSAGNHLRRTVNSIVSTRHNMCTLHTLVDIRTVVHTAGKCTEYSIIHCSTGSGVME